MKIELPASPEIAKFETERKEMLSVVEKNGVTHVRINSSSLSLMQECWRKSFLVLEEQRQARVESAATLYGTAIHAALEVFYAAPRADRVLPKGFARTVDLMGAGARSDDEADFLVLRAIRKFLEIAQPLAAFPPANKRSLSTGAWTLMHYFENFIDDPYEIMLDVAGKPMVEKKCEALVIDEPNLKVTLFGTIDCILRNPINNTILITDHKTSSVVGEQFYNRLHVNHQYSCYVLLSQLALGIQTDKFLVNCIQVKVRPTTSRGLPPHFPRQVTTRSPEALEDFRTALAYNIRQFLALREEAKTKGEDAFPLGHVGSCAAYNGCQFLRVCGAPKSIRNNILTSEFYGGEK